MEQEGRDNGSAAASGRLSPLSSEGADAAGGGGGKMTASGELWLFVSDLHLQDHIKLLVDARRCCAF